MLFKKTQGVVLALMFFSSFAPDKHCGLLMSQLLYRFCFVLFCFFLTRLHEELRRSIEAQMDVMHQGDGSGVEKEVMENMRHQLQLLSQVIISPAMVVFYQDQVMH